MKILILSTFERTGGAAVAANRLMQALNKTGHQAKMLVRDRQTDDPNVVSINTSWWKRKINFIRFAYERWVIFIHNRFSRKNLFQVSIANTGTDISKHPLVKEADIINLHWINQGFLSLKNIRQLTQLRKPVIWTMQDQWSIGGICHYTGQCRKYITQCTFCNMLVRPGQTDIAHKTFLKKKTILNDAKIHFVGSSEWITETAKQNAIYQNATYSAIPCPIDENMFFRKDKMDCITKFNLPVDKKLVLFAAAKLSDARKGMSHFIEACKHLKKQNIEIVFLGGKIDENLLDTIPLTAHILGYMHTYTDISAAYSACDVFVIPSLEDNLPNTIMESMACGTPCVGFNVGGIPEMIDHKQNGYVAEYKNAEDLAKGIEWVLENTEKLNLSDACVKKVKENYREDIVAGKYIELYENLLPENINLM
jgi:glycosyltransferase involved in cell wall biosynthesis